MSVSDSVIFCALVNVALFILLFVYVFIIWIIYIYDYILFAQKDPIQLEVNLLCKGAQHGCVYICT